MENLAHDFQQIYLPIIFLNYNWPPKYEVPSKIYQCTWENIGGAAFGKLLLMKQKF